MQEYFYMNTTVSKALSIKEFKNAFGNGKKKQEKY